MTKLPTLDATLEPVFTKHWNAIEALLRAGYETPFTTMMDVRKQYDALAKEIEQVICALAYAKFGQGHHEGRALGHTEGWQERDDLAREELKGQNGELQALRAMVVAGQQQIQDLHNEIADAAVERLSDGNAEAETTHAPQTDTQPETTLERNLRHIGRVYLAEWTDDEGRTH